MAAWMASGQKPTVVLQDSVIHVNQYAQNLSPEAIDALNADVYTSPSVARIDAASEYASCTTADHAYVWRCNSHEPTCYAFPMPATNDNVPVQCVLLPRPLNDSAEPALLLANSTGHLRFWEGVSDALTTPTADVVHEQLPLEPNESIVASARIDPSQAVFATNTTRLFCVHAYIHRGSHYLAQSVYTEHKGLLSRFFNATPGVSNVDPSLRLAVGPARDDSLHVLLYVVRPHALQVWRVPVMGSGASSHQPKHLGDDDQLFKAIASRVMYMQGKRYSPATSAQIRLLDLAPISASRQLVLYSDQTNTSASVTAYGLAQISFTQEGSLQVDQIRPLSYKEAPDPSRLPHLSLSSTAHRVALVTFANALVTHLLVDSMDAVEEHVLLKPGNNHILCATSLPSIASNQHQESARWAVQTSTSGVLLVDMDVSHAQQIAIDQTASSPTMHQARVSRLQEHLERKMWFSHQESNPLELDTLPDDLDLTILQDAVENTSRAIVQGQVACMPTSVDLRSALAQRVACCVRLITLLGRNGYIMRIARTSRFLLRCDAELLAGANDLWRFFDDSIQARSNHSDVLPAAIRSAVRSRDTPHDTDRYFFEHELEQTPALIQAFLDGIRDLDDFSQNEPIQKVIETTRYILSLRMGAARLRKEHGDVYALEVNPLVPVEPWYAHASSIELLETLFYSTLQIMQRSPKQVKIAELRTQLCNLAEFLMDTYDARIAFLTAATEQGQGAAQALEATKLAYDHVRAPLLHPLLSIGRADKAFALAEQHLDYRTLVTLCFAHADDHESIEKRAKIQHPTPSSQEPAEIRVEAYLDRYGASFANELYQYYIEHGAYRKLLEPQQEHAHLLLSFLNDRPQYRRIAWIHDLTLGLYERASHDLYMCASDERQNLEAKQGMLSLGKLSHLAQSDNLEQFVTLPSEQARLETWDDALDLVHVQQRLLEHWINAAHLSRSMPAEAAANRVVQVLAPHLAQSPAARAVFVMIATQLWDSQVVRGEDLMELLSLQDANLTAPSTAADLSDFAIAAQVLVRIQLTESRRKAVLATLWRRLYLQDDWYSLSTTANKTDQAVLDEVRNTIAYATIQTVLANLSTAPVLMSPEQVMQIPISSVDDLSEHFHGLPKVQLEQLHAEYTTEQSQLIEIVNNTKLSSFFSQVLTNTSSAELAPDSRTEDENSDQDSMDDTFDNQHEHILPGGAQFEASDEFDMA
ncbi:hypothetical protein MPSI1_002452 [Malassezia psittaci]|uniref:Nucleoporin Nup133/Nup155-like C-terminal domain-containing protein n=1 Tax=Malassezia psittaci TaxID=1821823 RepID=A0AAF0F6U7_9BASI|nr:hypothetical protein MPSI1_002452 [Malassezia psittaci]